MRKFIGITIFIICISFSSKAQFNVFDSAYVFGISSNMLSYPISATPLLAPAGPDYSLLWTTQHPKWFRWTVCGTDQLNYLMGNTITYSPGDTASVAIWGPFRDTTNINNNFNAAHLNQYYNFTGGGSGNFLLPLADSLGIYIVLVSCTNHVTANLSFHFDNLGGTTLHYDNRCGLCFTGIVNYEQKLCSITYDTAYSNYEVMWDKQNNYGIASFNIIKHSPSGDDSIGNVPVLAPGIFIDPVYDPAISSNLHYSINSIDSCGNTVNLSSSQLFTSYSYPVNTGAFDNIVGFHFPYKLSQPSSNKIYIYRGHSESNMGIIDSISIWTGLASYSDLIPPQGLSYYSLAYNDAAGCHPDSIAAINQVRTNTSLMQRICLVAFDTVLQKNVIIWENLDNKEVDHFNIYREGAIVNQFDSIGFVSESAPASFVDMGVNPNTKSYKYLIRPVDANGVVPGNLYSGYHLTIHLQASAGVLGEVNLLWNAYQGFGYSTYYVYRGSSANNMQVIDSIASGNLSYTDYSPAIGMNYYQVTVRNPYGCHPDSSTVVYEARSNSSYALVTGINDLQTYQVKLYPNPAGNFAMLDYSSLPYITHLDIINSLGVNVKSLSGNIQKKITINLKNFNKGVYYITAKTEKGLLRKKLVIY